MVAIRVIQQRVTLRYASLTSVDVEITFPYPEPVDEVTIRGSPMGMPYKGSDVSLRYIPPNRQVEITRTVCSRAIR